MIFPKKLIKTKLGLGQISKKKKVEPEQRYKEQ